MMQAFSRSSAGYLPRRVRLVLRDGSTLEGDVHATPGQSLADYFAGSTGWVNLTGVATGGGGAEEHTAVQTATILWVSPVQHSLPLSRPAGLSTPRPVEAVMEGGIAVRGSLELSPGQRLSDFLVASMPFIPLRRARSARDGRELGDVVLNRGALQRLSEAEEERAAPERPAVAGWPLPARRTEPRAEAGAASPAGEAPPSRQHWLASLAQRAGLLSGGAVLLAADAPARQAWPAVAEAAGVGEEELASRVAAHFGLRTAALDAVASEALEAVGEKTARRYGIVPLRIAGRHVVVATSDPMDVDAENALRFATGLLPLFEIAGPAAAAEALDAHYSRGGALEALVTGIDAELSDAVRVLEETRPETVQAQDVEAAPVVRLANRVLRDAVRQGASDVHLEPGRGGGAVRFRVDGVLRPYMQMPLGVLNRVVSRIKILGQLDIADRLRPQDGRARVEVEGRSYDLRISTVPTREAEKAVIRILNPGDARRLEDLGIPGAELAQIRQLLLHRSAIVLVTGPTGSGKTSTLYAALRELATGELNVMSVEDPVEYELAEVTQIQVEPRRNVTFASALRAILRQDPDVIFVGEIRDAETAQVAVQASLTGHLVLATLHTNDAASVVMRLADLGVERASIAAALRGVVAQRLVRRVCPSCVEPVGGAMTEEEERLAARYGVSPAVRAAGCGKCGGTGYRGRLPIAEVFRVTTEIERLVSGGAGLSELERASAAAGARSLMESALARVRAGETTLQEVERVLGEGSAGARA